MLDKQTLKKQMAAAIESENVATEDFPWTVSVNKTIPEQAEIALAFFGACPSRDFVLYGGKPHRIVIRDGRTMLELHTRESLCGLLGRTLRFEKYVRDKWCPTNPSSKLADDLLSLADYTPLIPVVRQIKSTPLLTDEGELIAEPGLHPRYQTYVDLDPTLAGMSLPKSINGAKLERAGEILLDPFQDFPVDEESVSNLIALLFTLVFRELIDGVTPLFVIDANAPGTGKGLLCSVASIIAYGKEADLSPGNVNGDELRKRLFAVAAQGAPMHVLDNVEYTMWSAELAAWLTAATYSDRKLHESATYSYPNRLVLLATGNNVRLGGDIERRSVLIRLVSDEARPDERSEFQYASLLDHVRRHRREILTAMYTIAATWLRNGRPVPKDAPRMGSFEAWCEFSAGILDTLDSTGLLENRHQLRGRDQDAEEFELMLTRARTAFGTKEFTAKELVSALDPDDLPVRLMGARQGSVSKSAGRLLTRLESRAFGTDELRVRFVRLLDHTKHYRIESKTDKKAHRNDSEAEG